MKITPEQYATALYQALEQVRPEAYDTVLDRFVGVLAQSGHLGMIKQIEAAYLANEYRQKGILPATVTFAQPHSAEGEVLDQLNNIFGKNLELQKKLDQSLVGGIVVETEDTQIDASIRGQLAALRQSLSN